MAQKKKLQKKYIVVFQDEDGTVLKTAFVPEQEAAAPPELPAKKRERAHYERIFAGWTEDFSKVEKNLVVRAVYKEVPKKYLVMYFDENDKLLGMEYVPYGGRAKAKLHPKKQEEEAFTYRFVGWNCALDHVEEDTRAKAVYEKKKKQYLVRFYHEDGSLLKEEQVEYGNPAHPPQPPEKEADAVYHYLFKGWSAETEHVTGSQNIVAQFASIYKEYTITFYDGENVIQEDTYHYGDRIQYPSCSKKGYDLAWMPHPVTAKETVSIRTNWTFSGPPGKEYATENGRYQIINPSLKNGSVCCLSYREKTAVSVRLPEKVKLGDYYYRIERIGASAFRDCLNMQKLFLPDGIQVINDRGFAGCSHLKEIYFGKGLKKLGADSFAGDRRLKKIIFKELHLTHCNKKAFDKLSSVLTVQLPKGNLSNKDKIREALGQAVCRGRVRLE